MAVDFSAFDKKVDLDALQEEVKNADLSSFEDVPDGTYIVGFDKMEIKPTKAKDKLMFAVQCKIKEGPHKGRLLFFNRVISGNKTSENGMMVRLSSPFAHGLTSWKQKPYRNFTIILTLLIVFLISFRKCRERLKLRLIGLRKISTLSLSMRCLTAN